MGELLLLRHAKSDWGDPGLPDIDRPLNARGQAAAAAMGREIARLGLAPDVVLASPARRVAETLAGVRQANPHWPPTTVDERIYAASLATLAQVLIERGQGSSVILLAGHSPGIEALALTLSADDGSTARANLEWKYPTGALARIIDWEGNRPGRLALFLRPGDLV